MRALIDGDMIAYICGFASDTNQYHCPDSMIFKYKKDAVNHCKDKKLDMKAIIKTVTHEPVENCLHSVKLMMQNIKDSTDSCEHTVFLSGAGNFREGLYSEYKANRKPDKPHWFTEIREYMENVWNADVVVGVEADDAMGWAQQRDMESCQFDEDKYETVICTLDKDLNMIPGWHYNWRSDEGKGMMYFVSEEDALSYFYQQWLTGDTADNIPGLPKVGEKTAQKILPTLGNTLSEVHLAILAQYRTHGYTAKHCHMVGDLLWIQRSPMQTWDQYMGLTAQRNANART